MRSRRISGEGEQPVWVVVFDKGDEPVSGLLDLARSHDVEAGSLTAVGAFASATLGYFDADIRDYARIEVDQQAEVLSLLGDIAVSDGTPAVHCHVVLGCRDGSTRGGHLLEAEVWPTLEVIVTAYPTSLHKRFDPETGLTLIDP